jgi:hypothetical protein
MLVPFCRIQDFDTGPPTYPIHLESNDYESYDYLQFLAPFDRRSYHFQELDSEP